MLSKRIIPCLDVRDGRLTKGIKFKENVDIGDPVEAAREYYEQGADEIVFYDITASVFTLTFSAPARITRRISSTVPMPPPTEKGMNIVSATLFTTSSMIARPSAEAVMS